MSDISQTDQCVTVNFAVDIHRPQRMNPNAFGGLLTFPLTQPSEKKNPTCTQYSIKIKML